MSNNKERNRIFSKKVDAIKPGKNMLSYKLCTFWKGQIDLVERGQSKWIKKGNTIVKRFRDERSRQDETSQRRMNLLWTNVKIMKPAIYSKCPTVIVQRKFLSRDPIGRLSASILERALRSEIEENGFHDTMNREIIDYLLVGRGCPWIRYEPEIGEGESLYPGLGGFEDELHDIEEEFDVTEDLEDDEEENQLESTGSQVISERTPVDYVDWRDLLIFPATARTWDEVQAVGKRIYISKQEAIERFGEEIGENMQPDTTPAGSDASRLSLDMSVLQDINDRNILCYEIWNKTDRRVYWVSTGYSYLADIRMDPLKLKGFFPVPKPLSATLTNDTVQPVPDYIEWQDQAVQIDELTTRIALLSKACKVAGTYDASNGALKRILSESVENELIPVDSWALHAEKGGVQGCISFIPIKEIQEVLKTLVDVRQQIKQDLDEVTGLSDVLRGTTDSRETLGGLRLKNNNAGTRLDERKNDVARFARDIIELVAEVMCKHYDDETLIKMSGVLLDDEMQPDAVMEDYRSDITIKLMNDPLYKSILQKLQQQPPPEASNMAPQGPQGIAPPGIYPPPMNEAVAPPQAAPMTPEILLDKMVEAEMARVTPELLIKQKIKAALKLLRDEISRGYRIDIETDSTIWADQAQERQDASEFITAVTKFMGVSIEMGAQLPESIPLTGKMLQFGVRKFRTGRDLESAIDEFVQKMDKRAKEMENAPPQPSEEERKAEAEINKINLEATLQKNNDERQAEVERRRQEREFMVQRTNDERDAQRQAAQDAREAELADQEMKRNIVKHNMEMEALNNRAMYEQRLHNNKMAELDAQHKAKMAAAKQRPKPASKPKAKA